MAAIESTKARVTGSGRAGLAETASVRMPLASTLRAAAVSASKLGPASGSAEAVYQTIRSMRAASSGSADRRSCTLVRAPSATKTTFSSSPRRVRAISALAVGNPSSGLSGPFVLFASPACSGPAGAPQSTCADCCLHAGAAAPAGRPTPTGMPSWWNPSSSARTRRAVCAGGRAPSEVVTASTSASRLPRSMTRARRSSGAPSVSMITWNRALPEWASPFGTAAASSRAASSVFAAKKDAGDFMASEMDVHAAQRRRFRHGVSGVDFIALREQVLAAGEEFEPLR